MLRYDFDQRVALLTRLTPEQLEEASFLDDRLLKPGVPHADVALPLVVQTALGLDRLCPLHFIFHTGHVGSTLTSRLLGVVPGVLSLREPFILRQVAQAMDHAGVPDSRIDPERMQRVFNATLNLMRRGFPDTHTVLVKVASVVGRIAPQLMAALPESRAIYLNVKPEAYVAGYLANPASLRDLLPTMEERIERLRREGLPDHLLTRPWTDGEQAALAWLAESLAEQRAEAALGDRLLRVDFDDTLADMEQALHRVLLHFSLPDAGETLQSMLHSPLRGRYSKAMDYEFSAAMRKGMLQEAARRHADEMQRAEDWLDRVAAEHAGSRACLTRFPFPAGKWPA